MKILLAEDNEANRFVLNAMLMSIDRSNEVTVVGTGLAAVEEFEKNKFDLVLLDCELDDMSGYDVARSMRKFETEKNLKRTSIVAVTAYVFMSDLNRCIESGMDGYLSKPVSIEDFRTLVLHWEKGLI